MEYCEIKRVKELELDEEEFKLIVLHHMKLCYDCYLLKNLSEEDFTKIHNIVCHNFKLAPHI